MNGVTQDTSTSSALTAKEKTSTHVRLVEKKFILQIQSITTSLSTQTDTFTVLTA